MFEPTRDEARLFFFETWRKHRAGEPLAGLEQTVLGVLIMHPEYHRMLAAPERFIEQDYAPESGETNPFLHLSLHLAVEEQVSIDQPPGIRAAAERLSARLCSLHDGRHAVMHCLAEMIWHVQHHRTPFDAHRYLGCLAAQESGAGGSA
jgi:hypothetical protein